MDKTISPEEFYIQRLDIKIGEFKIKIGCDSWIKEFQLLKEFDSLIASKIDENLSVYLPDSTNIPIMLKMIEFGSDFNQDIEKLSEIVDGEILLVLVFNAIYNFIIINHFKFLIRNEKYFWYSPPEEKNKYTKIPNPISDKQKNTYPYDEVFLTLMKASLNLPKDISLKGLMIYNRFLDRVEARKRIEDIQILSSTLIDSVCIANGHEGKQAFALIEQYKDSIHPKQKRKINILQAMDEIEKELSDGIHSN